MIALLGSGAVATTATLLVFQSPSAESIRSALATTTLDHLLFQDAPAREPVAVILNAVRKQHPDVRRLRVVTHKFNTDRGVADPLNHLGVTCDLRNIPADKALGYLYDTALVGNAVRDGAIHFYVHDYRGRVPPLTASERAAELCDAAYWKLWRVFYQ